MLNIWVIKLKLRSPKSLHRLLSFDPLLNYQILNLNKDCSIRVLTDDLLNSIEH